jgi:hypothetical protein
MTEVKTTASPTANTASKTTTTLVAKKEEKPVNKYRLKDHHADYLWTIIGLDDCPWTQKALALLKEHDANVNYVKLNRQWHARMGGEFNTRQIPLVLRGPHYIGNYSTIVSYFSGSFVHESERFD